MALQVTERAEPTRAWDLVTWSHQAGEDDPRPLAPFTVFVPVDAVSALVGEGGQVWDWDPAGAATLTLTLKPYPNPKP
eukprot:366299-Chlamydomonas_euryale.AAC.5